MSSSLAIVSKAVFEKQARGASLGTVLALEHYGSTHAALAGLAEGGALFLVTVRPPDEQLWLVAVLEEPKLGKSGWSAAANRVPITDISPLKKKLVFASGTGIQAKAGALGMSLQTPRVLTESDVALLRSGAGGQPAKDARVVAPVDVAIAAKKKSAPKAKPEPAAPGAAPAVDGGAHQAALQKAFAAKDGAAALTAALAWWREQRAPALADLIDTISAQISGPPVASQLEFARIAASKNPLDLGRLLPAMVDVQVNFLPSAALLLAAYPDDPRIPAAFAKWLSPPITTSISKTSFWSVMHATVERIGDARLASALKRATAKKTEESDWWLRFYNRLERTLAKLPAPPAFDAKPLAKLDAGKLAPIASAKAASAVVAPKLSGPLLAQAAAHLAAGRTVAAIDALVARWREHRVPALADLIDRATRLLPTYDRPLPHDGDPQAAWLAACESDPQTHLPQLLATLTSASHRHTEVRMAMIAGLPDDPRISLRLAEECECGGGREDMQLANTLFETLARHRDVRTCNLVRTLFDDFSSTYFYNSRPAKRFMGKLALAPEKFFDRWPLALDAADRAPFAKLDAEVDAALKKTFAKERALVAAIAEDWKSRGPREVYADWLLERGHPRGELIMLESKPSPSAAERARLDELHKQGLFFGPIDTLIDHGESKRERGLYREITLAYHANTLSWRAAAASPLVALIETVTLAQYLPTLEDFAAFVTAATRLRRINGMSRQQIEQLDPEHTRHWKVVGSGKSQHVVRVGPE
jgi:uncharacterized protein (TIGR02996 family)